MPVFLRAETMHNANLLKQEKNRQKAINCAFVQRLTFSYSVFEKFSFLLRFF